MLKWGPPHYVTFMIIITATTTIVWVRSEKIEVYSKSYVNHSQAVSRVKFRGNIYYPL